MTTLARPNLIGSGATFSNCRRYRYALWRNWFNEGPRVAFIGLNPSTADESANDPTIRRCIGFARGWGYSGLVMVNLFAWRATDPKHLAKVEDPVGPMNDETLLWACCTCTRTVAAWGANRWAEGRAGVVTAQLLYLWCLGTTKAGQPKHPLYLPKSAELVPYTGVAA